MGHRSFVDRRLGGEVEAFERFGRRELGGFEPTFGCSAFTLKQFQLDQLQQEADVPHVLLGTSACDFGVLPQQRWQL